MAHEPEPAEGDAAAAFFAPRLNRDAYVRAIKQSQEKIYAGETYEVCLTNQLVRPNGGFSRRENDAERRTETRLETTSGDDFRFAPDPATLYSVLRATNPAPYAAYLCFGGCEATDDDDDGDGASRASASQSLQNAKTLPGARVFLDDERESDDEVETTKSSTNRHRAYAADDVIAVCCCSPERFLRLSRDVERKTERARPGGEAHQGHGAAARAVGVRGGRRRGGRAGAPREGSSREPDDRGLAAQRPGAGLRAGVGFRSRAHEDRELRDGAPAGEHGARDAASEKNFRFEIRDRRAGGGRISRNRGRLLDRVRHRGVPSRVDDRRAEARTCEIIDGLESSPRGVYSGAIGYFSAAGDAFDLNVCIRTCVVRPATDEAWIGCGGAITALSDADEEWEETRLKARAVLRAVRAVDEATDAERASRARSRHDEP